MAAMTTVTRNVRDADDRRALEHVLGGALREDQQIVISVQTSAPGGTASMPPGLDGRAGDSLKSVLNITRELFGREVLVQEDCDPESPDDKYVVFAVDVADADSAVRLEREWVKRVRPVSSRWPNFRLSLNVNE